jgi:hypothetical protein
MQKTMEPQYEGIFYGSSDYGTITFGILTLSQIAPMM